MEDNNASASLGNSFCPGAGAYVKGPYAITSTGVIRKGAGRALSVSPQELEWGGRVLGRGASGCVMLSRHLPTNTPLALKVIPMFDKTRRAQAMREVHALFDAQCPCLVTLYGAFLQREHEVVLALEYMDGGSLENVISQVGAIRSERALAGVAFQVLEALRYMQERKKVVHRDIKPPNVLLNSRGEVKLSDFGIASQLGDSIAMCGTFVGSFRYMSPERIQRAPYSFSSDIWSLGLVLLEAATGVFPYHPMPRTTIDMVQTVLEAPAPALSPLYFSPELCGFLGDCLRKAPDERASARQLLDSAWLKRCGVTSALRCIVVAVLASSLVFEALRRTLSLTN